MQLPDSLAVTWQYPQFVMNYTNCIRQSSDFDAQGNHFLGTLGWLQMNRTGYRYRPNRAGPRGGPAAPPFEPVSQSFRYEGGPSDHAHVRKFLDCVKSRQQPFAHAEAGHRTASICHLNNIAMKVGRTLKWDPKAEQFIGDDEANKMLKPVMREPWMV